MQYNRIWHCARYSSTQCYALQYKTMQCNTISILQFKLVVSVNNVWAYVLERGIRVGDCCIGINGFSIEFVGRISLHRVRKREGEGRFFENMKWSLSFDLKFWMRVWYDEYGEELDQDGKKRNTCRQNKDRQTETQRKIEVSELVDPKCTLYMLDERIGTSFYSCLVGRRRDMFVW